MQNKIVPKVVKSIVKPKKSGNGTNNAKTKNTQTSTREIPKGSLTTTRVVNKDVRKVDGKSDVFNADNKVFISVKSSNLKGFHYDDKTRELLVKFNSGKDYMYKNVPKNIVVGLMNAASKGVYFGQKVRYKYSYKEI